MVKRKIRPKKKSKIEIFREQKLLKERARRDKTLGGRISKGITKRFARPGITQRLSVKDLTEAEKRQVVEKMKKHFRGRKFAPISPPQLPQDTRDPFFNRVFSEGTPMARQVEREIMVPGGHMDIGDNVAFAMAKSPTKQNAFDRLEAEVSFFAKVQDVVAVGDVAKEAVFFANLVP